jgi:hypothetical protein
MPSSNGHSSPAVIAANQRVEQCRKRLAAIDEKLAALNLKLARAVEAQATVVAQLQAAEQAMASDAPDAERAWQQARVALSTAEARCTGLKQLVAEQERLRLLPGEEYQAACLALSTAINAEDLDRARREAATARHARGQAELALTLAQDRCAKADKVVFTMEAAQRKQQQRGSPAPRTTPQYGYYNPGPA